MVNVIENVLCTTTDSYMCQFSNPCIKPMNNSFSYNPRLLLQETLLMNIRLSVKALAGPCRTEPTIAPEVGIRRITVFGTGF